MIKSAIYAGSFDPWTTGHSYVLHCAATMFDEIHIVIGINQAKKSLLETNFKKQIIYETLTLGRSNFAKQMLSAVSRSALQTGMHTSDQFEWHGTKIKVTETAGLIVDYATNHGVGHLIRGLRNAADYEAESQLAQCNFALNPEIKMCAIFCPQHLAHVSSGFARQVVGSGHDTGTSFLAQAMMLNAMQTNVADHEMSLAFLGHLCDQILYRKVGSNCKIKDIFYKVTKQKLQELQNMMTSVLDLLNDKFPDWDQKDEFDANVLQALLAHLVSRFPKIKRSVS